MKSRSARDETTVRSCYTVLVRTLESSLGRRRMDGPYGAEWRTGQDHRSGPVTWFWFRCSQAPSGDDGWTSRMEPSDA